MLENQTPAILVARFLKANHYTQTLDTFLREANLDPKTADTNPGDWTLEKIVQEKIQFDTSINFERRDVDLNQGWTNPAPSTPTEPELTIDTNVLCVRGDVTSGKAVAISTANNSCNFVQSQSPYTVLTDRAFKADGPILSMAFLHGKYIISACMSGRILIHDNANGQLVTERRDHTKWAVYVACWEDPNGGLDSLIATAGWDQRIHIYSVPPAHDGPLSLDAPVHSISLQTNPESLLFVTNPDTQNLYLIASRRDSSFLFYYRVDFATTDSTPSRPLSVIPAGRQNLAPHANAWVAFTPSAMSLHPSDASLVAVATSHLPHLKVIIVRLLFPDTMVAPPGSSAPDTIAAVARADLALQEKEDAAINLQVSTQAPQTPFSTPQIAWRPDGSGVWVNGDDGVVRGVEAKTGKVVALLRAHEIGSKVRTLWAGTLLDEGGSMREVLVSGGFDRKVFIWEISATSVEG